MLDFPNSPALNQIFTSGNLLWTWDGVKWLPASSGATVYVAKSGDTMTGNLIVNPGNVGIGTTTPSAPLHVGAAQVNGANPTKVFVTDTVDTTGGAPIVSFARSGQANPQRLSFAVNQAGLYGAIQAAQDNVAFNTLLLNPSGGNVGIGTTTPHTGLEVKNGLSLGDTNGLSFNSYYAGGWFYNQAGAAASIGVSPAGMGFYVAPSGTAGASASGLAGAMSLNANGGAAFGSYGGVNGPPANGMIIPGNVGIGTAAPGAKLDVSGQIVASGGIASVGWNDRTLGAAAGWNFYSSAGDTFLYSVAGAANKYTFYATGELYIVGANAYKPGGGAWTVPSSRELKSNIVPYPRGLADVLNLNPVSYYYNGKGGLPTDRSYVGLISEDVEPVMPELVGSIDLSVASPDDPGEDEDGNPLPRGVDHLTVPTIDASDLIYVVINSLKEINDRLVVLEGRA